MRNFNHLLFKQGKMNYCPKCGTLMKSIDADNSGIGGIAGCSKEEAAERIRQLEKAHELGQKLAMAQWDIAVKAEQLASVSVIDCPLKKE